MEQFERASFTMDAEAKDYGKFLLKPLGRGFGTTIGNALRRTLLSSIPGGSVYAIKIEGVYHEFTAIPGVVEDVTAIILNLKSLVLSIKDDDDYTLRLDVIGPKTVTAGDIISPLGVEVVNPDLVIAHVSDGGKLNVELKARNGRGYVSADENKAMYNGSNFDINTIFIDSIFTPVKKVSVVVEPTRIGQNTKYDALTIEVWTNGGIEPHTAIALAAKILMEHLDLVTSVDEKVNDIEVIKEASAEGDSKGKNLTIDDLDLTVRSYNCLKRSGITTVDELTQMTSDQLMKVKNLGKKSYQEVIQKLETIGKHLRDAD